MMISDSPSSEGALKSLQIYITIKSKGALLDHLMMIHCINPVLQPVATAAMNESQLHKSETPITSIVGKSIIPNFLQQNNHFMKEINLTCFCFYTRRLQSQ